MEHRLTFAFIGLTQRQYNKLAREVDAFVDKTLAGTIDYEVYSTPSGPSDWDATDVDIRLDGIRKERSLEWD